ncbi:MAG TPA: GyrI-like domain-containing protein [Devosia sp.]
MTKIDVRKTMPELYGPKATAFEIVDVPPLNFIMVDGRGDPNVAADYAAGLSWLYSLSYTLKFQSKAGGQDYVVPPLEALWWADDMADFVNRRKDRWYWTQMIMVPEFVSPSLFDAARQKVETKLGVPPASLRWERFHEGLAVQILHIGPYDAEAPTIRRMHEEFMPAHDLAPSGRHHEIYLSDPRRVAASKLKTIIRQPVQRLLTS